MKHIVKHINGYLTQQAGRAPPSERVPDLQKIAQEHSYEEIDKLLRLVLLTAINSTRVADYVIGLQSLSRSTQEALKGIIEEEQGAIDAPSETSEPSSPIQPSNHLRGDSELVYEERLGTIVAEKEQLLHDKKTLQKDLGDLHDRHARLQENHDILQVKLTNTEDRLRFVKSGKDGSASSKGLEEKYNEQADIIATLENKDRAAQAELEDLRKSNETYRIKTERLTRLQDDYDMLKAEKEKLTRAANMAEKYKAKIQSSQEMEKENSSLKKQVNDLRAELRGFDNSESNVAFLQKQIGEYQILLPNIEQHRNELQEQKKSLEFDNHVLSERLSESSLRLKREENAVEELQERIRELEEPGTPTTPKPRRTNGSFYGLSNDESQA